MFSLIFATRDCCSLFKITYFYGYLYSIISRIIIKYDDIVSYIMCDVVYILYYNLWYFSLGFVRSISAVLLSSK